jgi:MarR family transcriptional regulator, temperature-dependent positive regulator of motility
MSDDGFVLAKSPSHLLHRAQQLASDRFARALGSDNVTLRQFAVLAAIAGKAGQTQTDLVNATGIDRSTLADMVLRMEDRGLLVRVRAEDDGRAKSVALTSSGRSAFNASGPSAKAADDALMATIPRAKRGALIEALQALAEAAAQEPPEMPAPKRAVKGRAGAKKPAKKATRAVKKPARKAPAKKAARR